MKFRGGEFSTGTMRNFQPELTNLNLCISRGIRTLPGPSCYGRCVENLCNPFWVYFLKLNGGPRSLSYAPSGTVSKYRATAAFHLNFS